jgi:hypothetical protein
MPKKRSGRRKRRKSMKSVKASSKAVTWDEPEPEPEPVRPLIHTTLPPGWTRKVSRSTGETYYYDAKTGAKRWDIPVVQSGRQRHGKSILDRIETLERHVTEFSDQGKALALLKELRALAVVNNYILEWKNTKFFKMLYPFGDGNEMRPVIFKKDDKDGNFVVTKISNRGDPENTRARYYNHFITHIPSGKTYIDTQGFFVAVE